MPGSIGNALRLGMDLGNYGQQQALNAEALRARKFQNALLPEERAYELNQRGVKQASDAETARQQKVKFGAEMVEKTLPRVTYENYAGWRQEAISQWGVPEKRLPAPEAFPDTDEGRSKFTTYSQNLYVRVLELQGKKEAAQVAADRARDTANISADRARDTAGIGAAARIKAAEIGAGKSRETAQIGADSRIEAAKIRAAAGVKPMKPEAARKRITDIRRGIATLEKTGQVDPVMAAMAEKLGLNLPQGATIDPAIKKAYTDAANEEINALQQIVGMVAPPAPSAATVSPYKTKEDVKAAYAAKKITREQAADILRKQFGFK